VLAVSTILFGHLFLNATEPAILCAFGWWVLVRTRLLATPMLGVGRGVFV
jgi:hypothetical protein